MIIYIVATLYVYEILLIVRIISSWIMSSPQGDFMRFLYQVTEPYLALFRRILPFLCAGGIDFSPIAGFILLEMVINSLRSSM